MHNCPANPQRLLSLDSGRGMRIGTSTGEFSLLMVGLRRIKKGKNMIIVGSGSNSSKEYFAKMVEEVSGIPVGVVSMGHSSSEIDTSVVSTNHNGHNNAAYFVADENLKKYLELTKQKIK
ncbi:MAG TPA: hypothetical protein PLZ05_01705 [Alphaproteobacteria bacterium]|nr:hypothetical protein [Alphaproteobacteria bacterium]